MLRDLCLSSISTLPFSIDHCASLWKQLQEDNVWSDSNGDDLRKWAVGTFSLDQRPRRSPLAVMSIRTSIIATLA